MALTGELFMRDDPQTLQKRLARFVRDIPAKELALIADCSERTAENMRRGHWPLGRHWLGLVRTFGRDLTEAVFHPDAATARLEEEVAELEAKLAQRRATLKAVVETSGPRPRARVAAAQGSGGASTRHVLGDD